jgi:hypothetical protein
MLDSTRQPSHLPCEFVLQRRFQLLEKDQRLILVRIFEPAVSHSPHLLKLPLEQTKLQLEQLEQLEPEALQQPQEQLAGRPELGELPQLEEQLEPEALQQPQEQLARPPVQLLLGQQAVMNPNRTRLLLAPHRPERSHLLELKFAR